MILSPHSASDELQMTAREVKDTGSDSLSATLTLRTFFWQITFSFSAHLHRSLWLPSSPLPPLPLLASARGDWKVQERAGSLIRPREPRGMGLGWGSAGDQQAQQEPSSDMCRTKRCCFFPPAQQSRSQQVDWNRVCSLLVLHSSYFCKLFVYCY